MKKIAIISVYFGDLPNNYKLWIRSCEYNKDIDFFLFTDQKINYIPNNLKVIPISFNCLRERIKSTISTDIKLERHYKLCDYRPMYGIIFKDILTGYDYWGHCDMDMIFGNISKFLDLYQIEKYERFLHLGHLSLYKNTKENNERYKLKGSECGSWLKVISTDKNCLFDEWRGIYGIYKKNNIPMFEERIFADISEIYKRFRLALDDKNYDNQIFFWENGAVYRNYWLKDKKIEEEFIYIHFKRRSLDYETFDAQSVTGFFIGPNGFTEKKYDNIVTISDVQKYNPFPGESFEDTELKNFKRRKKKRFIDKIISRITKVYNIVNIF